jgi:hypothetical protein
MGKIDVPNIIMRKVDELVPYIRNTKLHPPRQVKKIAMSIEQYGFNVPVIIDAKNEIIAGHGRLLAALELKMVDVPCVCIDHLSTEQVRAFRIADNKVAESEWEAELLEEELKELFSENFDLELTGFGTNELKDMLNQTGEFQKESETYKLNFKFLKDDAAFVQELLHRNREENMESLDEHWRERCLLRLLRKTG